MNNTFCSKCHRIPSQCCCGSVKELTDEELDRIIDSVPYPRTHAMDKHMIKVAFRKAQEK